jgi:hypothetical protein
MVTRGQRRLGRTIRTLENSVEFSPKESKARESERKYKEKIEQSLEDSPVQDLRLLVNRRNSDTRNEKMHSQNESRSVSN